jgi:hypothetical protein
MKWLGIIQNKNHMFPFEQHTRMRKNEKILWQFANVSRSFPENWELPRNSMCQKGDIIKQVPYWGSTKTWRRRTKFSRHGDMALRICTPLAQTIQHWIEEWQWKMNSKDWEKMRLLFNWKYSPGFCQELKDPRKYSITTASLHTEICTRSHPNMKQKASLHNHDILSFRDSCSTCGYKKNWNWQNMEAGG